LKDLSGHVHTDFCQRLRSASSHQVSVPRYRLSRYGRRAFSVAGPTVWNSLPEDMWDPGSGVFCGQLQTVTEDIFNFCSTSVFSALEACYENALYKFNFDIDIDIDILSLGTCSPNLYSAALTVLGLLAFSSQKFSPGHQMKAVHRLHPPFTKFTWWR